MKYLIGLLLATNIYAADCKQHPIYCQIINNVSSINRTYAMRLSNIIDKSARKFKIDPKIYTAILAQESRYNLKAKNCSIGIIETNKHIEACIIGAKSWNHPTNNFDIARKLCHSSNKRFVEQKVCYDFGISQINYKTAKAFNLELHKLTTDLNYSVEAGARILADFKTRYGKREPSTYWTRYNASSPSKRKVYKERVRKFYDYESTKVDEAK